MNNQESRKLENKVIKILKQHVLKNNTIIAGISGGPDSVFLLHILAKLPVKIIVAHVNHQIRKKDADLDENFTRQFAKNHIFELKTADIPKLAKKYKKGIEETSRKVRYEFFKKIAKKHKARLITTAHHADDNLETIILNLTRGATLKGLSGMKTYDPPLLRPLLDIPKDKIIAYLKFHKIKFRTDKSNQSQIYKRNVVRKKIIPELKKINPNITQTIAKNTETLREINEFLENEANIWLKKNPDLNAKKFRILTSPLQKTIIRAIYKTRTGSTKNLENIHLSEILKVINQNVGKKRKKMGKLTFSLEKNRIKVVN